MKKILNKSSLPFLSFIQTTLLAIYVISLVSFLTFITPIFDTPPTSEFYAPIIMLMLFIISAVISATLFLGRAAVFFWNKEYKKSFATIGWNLVWGIIYIILFFVALYIQDPLNPTF